MKRQYCFECLVSAAAFIVCSVVGWTQFESHAENQTKIDSNHIEASDDELDPPAASIEFKPIQIGKSFVLHSKVLAEDRTINVFLPPGYEKSKASYPVVYLLDGAIHEDYHHMTGLFQFLTMYQLMPESIVIAIANTDRTRDMTHPTQVKAHLERSPQAGGSANFISFIKTELQPAVEKQFRSNGDRMLIGQSLGGLLATEILVTQPELFEKYLIVSPSLWWNNGELAKRFPEFVKSNAGMEKKVFLALGDEGDEMQSGVDAFVAALKEHAGEKWEWKYDSLPDENHATVMHRATYQGFEFFFSKTHPGL